MSEDLPVPGGVTAFAEALDIRPAPDRARFVSEVARLIHGLPTRQIATVPALVRTMRQMALSGANRTDLVPVPLTAAVWTDAVFHRKIAPADLIVTILSDRQAAFLAYGLSGLDDETLQYFGEHGGILSDIYLKNAPLFAAFAGTVHVRSGRVVPPGGAAAVPLWEAAVGANVDRPERFLSALWTLGDGRLAYLYDTIGQLEPERAAFALGLWMDDPAARVPGMQALVTAWSGSFRDWRVRTQPFARSAYDLSTALMRMSADATGRPRGPGGREFWSRVFESLDVPDDGSGVRPSAEDRPIDAAWLAAALSAGDARTRVEHLDQFGFGQRVFADAAPADMGDVFVAVRAFRTYRALMTTLERMGVRKPSVYAAAAHQATRVAPSDSTHAFLAMAQFQGALALLHRMTAVGTIDHARSEALVASLVAIPLNGSSQYAGGVVGWIGDVLKPALGREDTVEGKLLAALSGPAAGRSARVVWEGRDYRVDPAAAERRRLERVRQKQGGVAIDQAIEVQAQARRLAMAPALDVVQAVDVRVKTVAAAVQDGFRRMSADDEGLPPGVKAPPNPREPLARASEELTRIVASRDVSGASRVAADLFEAADDLGAETLMSLVYAMYIGDPEGSTLLAGDVSRRHDFGFGQRFAPNRLRAPWAMPSPDVSAGIPWHVDGAVLGLDVGLAVLQLRRLSTDHVVDAPTLSANQRDTFAVSVAMMNPFALSDASRDTIVDAVERGRRRVSSLKTAAELERVAGLLGVDGWRRRAAAWTLAHEPDRMESLFSLGEFLALGEPGHEFDLDSWGMAANVSTGCVCTVMPAPGRLPMLLGHPQIGLLATSIPDLNLHVARMLADLHVPAMLARAVLAAAVQDFVDSARATDSDDWLTLVRTARTLSVTQIEDYVAAAAADGPLVLEGSLDLQGGR